jgi:glycosyltransferase involved in cell wall biosynthesis
LVLREHSIAFDGHSLAWKWSGTQQVTIGFIEGMSRLLASRRLAVMVPPSLPDDIKHRLESLGNVDVIIIEDISTDRSLRFDVLVRPYQVNSVEELRWMKRIASRCIVAHLDFISYNNPTYFNSDHDWLTFRELTNLVLAAVDGIAWISEYVKSDANRLGLLTGSVANLVTYNGVELPDSTDSAQCPARLASLEGPMISVLGVAFHHKNRLFALRILRELLGTNPDVTLVFAGPTPQPGSSHDEESEFLRSNPHVASRFVDLGAVDVPERNWVLAHSAVVLYPTLSEGFGLIPFEAASAGSPVISSRMGSLAEVIPDDVPSFGNFDPQECATLVSRMLGEGVRGRAPNNSLIARSEQYSWNESCSRMLALIDDVLKRPKNRTEGIWGEAPVPAQMFSPEYARTLNNMERRARTYRRWSNFRLGRVLIGRPGSARRRLAKTLYRRIRG